VKLTGTVFSKLSLTSMVQLETSSSPELPSLIFTVEKAFSWSFCFFQHLSTL